MFFEMPISECSYYQVQHLSNEICYVHTYVHMYSMYVCMQGRIQDFSKGGSQGNGYIYKLYYIHIAIIHIIILNEVYCNLLKAINA